MAKQHKTKKATTKKREVTKKGYLILPPLPRPGSGNLFLDLTGTPDRPTVRLDAGDFEMKLPEELTFAEFARQAVIGTTLVTMSSHADEEGVLDDLQELVMEAAGNILVDLTDEAGLSLTPGMYLKISNFFNGLVDVSATTTSESGLDSAPGASDSTGVEGEE